MTLSRRVSSAVMVRAATLGDVVAAGAAGFDDELFAAQLAQVVGALADAVVLGGLSGHRPYFGGELARR